MKIHLLLESSEPHIKELAEKLHSFSLEDPEGKEAWDIASSMFQDPEENDPDYEEGGSPDPGNAACYFMDRIFECIHRNEYEDTIVERANLVQELEALTEKERDDLYDELYEGIEAGLD